MLTSKPISANDIKVSYNKREFDTSILGKDDYKYIDPESLSETIVKFEFPTKKVDPDDEYGDIMIPELYLAIANILKMQYLLPVKYLKSSDSAFSYIAQRAQCIGEFKGIENAAIIIEPLNANFQQQISYTHINQMIPVGTVFTIHAEIPFRSKDGSPGPFRKMLTSASIKTEIENLDKSILEESKKNGITNPTTKICNKRIAYGALDIGSKLDMRLTVEYTTNHESMTLFRFRRPADNIIEFIYYDHWNINMQYILRLMKECKRLNIPDDQREYLNDLLDKMISRLKN